MKADFIVAGPRGMPRAFFEVKRRSKTSPSWASQLRQNLLDQAAIPAADYFAIVTPEVLYLWPPGAAPNSDPVRVSIEGTLRNYAIRLKQDLTALSSQGFELLIGAWLGDLINGQSDTELPLELLAAVRGGRLVSESGFDA